MKGVFIGTGAADFFHTIYCEEKNCPLSRKEGGLSLRGSAGFLLDDIILLDASWSAFDYFQKKPQAIAKLQSILITHSHKDHFLPPVVAYLAEQKLRVSKEPLRLMGNHTVIAAMKFYLEHKIDQDGIIVQKEMKPSLELTQLVPFQWISLGSLRFLPLPANHAILYTWQNTYPDAIEYLQDKWPLEGALLFKQEDAFNYLISYNQKKMFYGMDSAWPLPETMAVLKQHHLDLAILDATFGFKEPLPGHMNFEILVSLVEELGLANKAIASHLSLHWVPPHSQVEPWLAERKIKLAYDGMRVSS